MKPKTMILMVVAVACGLGASYMTSKLLANRNNTPAPVETVDVLVTTAKVPAWQPIKEPEYTFAPGPAASERIQRRYASRDRAPTSTARHPLARSGTARARKRSAR